MRTVLPMMAGIGASNRAAKLLRVNWCSRLLVNGFTVQNAVTSMTMSDAR